MCRMLVSGHHSTKWERLYQFGTHWCQFTELYRGPFSKHYRLEMSWLGLEEGWGTSQFFEDLRSPSGAAPETENRNFHDFTFTTAALCCVLQAFRSKMKLSWQNHLTACLSRAYHSSMTDDNVPFWGRAVRWNNMCLAGWIEAGIFLMQFK